MRKIHIDGGPHIEAKDITLMALSVLFTYKNWKNQNH